MFLKTLFLIFFSTPMAFAGIWQTGRNLDGIRDYREVMPGVLYRGGSNVRAPLTNRQLNALCGEGIGEAYYLYSTGFRGPLQHDCGAGQSIEYKYKSWEQPGLGQIHQAIYNTIKTSGSPVFVHCWYGIHATGAVSATALMQFCGVSAQTAVEYWKVGVAKSVQYKHVIDMILAFKPDASLQLTASEQKKYCPTM